MKNPKLRVRRRPKRKNVHKTKIELTEIVDDCLRDIRWYIVKDIVEYLKKRGLFDVKKKNKKKN